MSNSAPVIDPNSESSALFNPAFCAVLLNKACAAYESKSDVAMPVTFAFLILPSALHKPTREALPGTTASGMWTWLRNNPIILMDFAERVRSFRPLAAAGIAYGVQHAVLIGAAGIVTAGALSRRPRSLRPTNDWNDCVKSAEFLGRWFGGTDTDEATTLAHWGVTP